MKLEQLLRGLKFYDFSGGSEKEIESIAYDSRQVKPGTLFVALRGHNQDGHDYLKGAVDKGATALVAEEFNGIHGDMAATNLPMANLSMIRVPDSRKALSELAVQFYGRPFEGINLIGITGTNGKTTTSYLLESILRSAGARPGVIGTINYRYQGEVFPASVTTPELLDLMSVLRKMADGGVTDVIMEVSSHALDQKRTDGCPFKVAVFTNLSRDHLDYHKTMDDYFRAKSLLFKGIQKERDGVKTRAVINLDDPRGEEIAELTDAEIMTYSLSKETDIHAAEMVTGIEGLETSLITPLGEKRIRSSLIGGFNIYNIMAAAGAALSMDIPLDAVVNGVEGMKTVPGRLEPVENRRGLKLIVDYAHTPDALLKIIKALSHIVEGRLITVFGCGGDRDRGKRPEMGMAAGENSDLVFITSDNPRSEEPMAIINEIEEGVKKTDIQKLTWPWDGKNPSAGYFVEPDRRKAIHMAVSVAREADIVLIAGKGHEDYQIVGKEKRFFDDRREAAAAMSNGG